MVRLVARGHLNWNSEAASERWLAALKFISHLTKSKMASQIPSMVVSVASTFDCLVEFPKDLLTILRICLKLYLVDLQVSLI